MGFDAFIKIDGIEGESKDDGHKGWVEILNFSHGVSQATTGTASSTGSGAGQRCDMTPFHFAKQLDKASPKLNAFCAGADAVKTVDVELCRAGGDKQLYMKYKLSDCIISSVQVGGASAGDGGVPIEEVGITYGKIEWEYTVIGNDNKPAGKVPAGWDLGANKKV